MNEEIRCKNCVFLGVQSHSPDNVSRVKGPACRRHAPQQICGTGSGYSSEMFPEVDPAEDWCGDHSLLAEGRMGSVAVQLQRLVVAVNGLISGLAKPRVVLGGE